MYKHILIATDGSVLADKAVEQGLALAKAVGAKATVYTATLPWQAVVSGDMAVGFPVPEYDEAQLEHAKAVLERAKMAAATRGVACEIVHGKDQNPAEGIVDAATKGGCDLIVMASHGRRGVSRLLLGSQANNVVTHSSVPVLIVR